MQVLNACSSLQDLFLNMSSLINSSTLAHALSIPTSLQGSDCTLSCCISQYGCNTFCPCPNFTCPNIMALQETTVCLGMHPVEHSASSMLPHLAYISTKGIGHKNILTTTFNELFVHTPAFIPCPFTGTCTKVIGSGCTPSNCICWKSSNAICPSPHFTCPRIMAVHETTLRIHILLNTLSASLMHLAYMSTRVLATKPSDLR